MYVRAPREVCLRETGKAPIKTRWAETDQGQPGKPNVRARWVAKEYKTHARPELYASTPPLETLKVVLSEISTGDREVLALVGVRRAYFYAPARKVFVELPPEDCQLGDEHMCGLLRYSLCATRAPACGEAASRERTSWQPCIAMTSQSVGNGRQWSFSSRRYQKSMRSGNMYSGKIQTPRRAGEYSTVSLNGIATAPHLRQIRGTSER